MGYGLKAVEKMKAIGRFVITEDGEVSQEKGHLPVTPIEDGAGWRRSGDAVKPEVAICLLSSGRYCPPEMHLAMAMLQVPMPHAVIGLKGKRRDLARIEMLEQARGLGAEFAVMFDDDNPPPGDAVVKMLEVFRREGPKLGAVAGIYVGKCDPRIPLVFKFGPDNPGGLWFDWQAELVDGEGRVTRPGEVFECDAIASGCMMVRLSMLDHLEPPWFLEVHSAEEAIAAQPFVAACPRGYYVEVTDDMYFCFKLRAAGFRIMAHGGVLPGHWDDKGNCYRLNADSQPMRED